MNQRPQCLKVQKAIIGFLHYKSAEGLAPVTVSGYERIVVSRHGTGSISHGCAASDTICVDVYAGRVYLCATACP